MLQYLLSPAFMIVPKRYCDFRNPGTSTREALRTYEFVFTATIALPTLSLASK